ncbi:MAG TPA: type II toxin-antitoxin system PrlF family antitoxin [Kiritimatiellia bacterium]|nr:type II toxin-antitoxin system PrlF family antitoxin [Kiritimatiellia bacterium]HRU70469.1 type II toxin-antitoxin system PrlF family antitoxin [Kiritimatiellia bacterium]
MKSVDTIKEIALPAIQSTVLGQYQTTIPLAIRKRLGIEKKDTIRYRVVSGAVVIEKAEPLTERLRSLHAGIRKKVELEKIYRLDRRGDFRGAGYHSEYSATCP